MSEKSKKIIRLCYGIYLSVCIVVAAILIIISCRALYNGGDALYSPEAVAEKYSGIAIPLQISVLSIVAGFILHLVFPLDNSKITENSKDKKKSTINYSMVLERMHELVDINKCDDELAKRIKKQRRLRIICTSVCAALCTITSVPAVAYVCNPNNYASDGTIVMKTLEMSVVVGFWCLVAFIFTLALSIITYESKKKEVELLRAALKNKTPAPESKYTPEKERKRNIILNSVRGAILLVAVIFVVVGIINGGMDDVLQKAIKLCTECVGLG